MFYCVTKLMYHTGCNHNSRSKVLNNFILSCKIYIPVYFHRTNGSPTQVIQPFTYILKCIRNNKSSTMSIFKIIAAINCNKKQKCFLQNIYLNHRWFRGILFVRFNKYSIMMHLFVILFPIHVIYEPNNII